MTLLFAVISALMLDKIFGEPRRYHPLVQFGALANCIEKKLNTGANKRYKGICAVILAIVPLSLIIIVLDKICSDLVVLNWLLSSVVLYLAIGWQSLIEHAANVAKPLQAENIEQARKAVSFIVSRDTRELSEEAVAKAGVESVLENGADAVFAPIFWFCVFGVPGVFIYRLSNTLDAMWGYKNTRFLEFGWCAARMDDVLNFIPARLTALSYALMGDTTKSLSSWQEQGSSWESPNAGHVMAAGAGALNVFLGGNAVYGEQLHQRVSLGVSPDKGGQIASSTIINDACSLLNKSLALWVAALILLVAIFESLN